MELKNINIGLFGTCGGSKWRDNFITAYDRVPNVEYFNPFKENWTPQDAKDEAYHLANDDIILFPVTDETYGIGSLSEVGFSILQAIKINENRDFIIFIDDNINVDSENYDKKLEYESYKARALVKQHLFKLDLPNVYIVDSLDSMLVVSLKLIDIQEKQQELKKYINSLNIE